MWVKIKSFNQIRNDFETNMLPRGESLKEWFLIISLLINFTKEQLPLEDFVELKYANFFFPPEV